MECSSTHPSRFVIVHFTDLHYGESESNDLKSKGVMQRVLDAERPIDLVVFGGDQVSGWLVNSRWLTLSKWLESISIVNGMKIHFATIFGNHDDQPYAGDPPGMLPWVTGMLMLACLALAGSMHFSNLRKSSPFIACLGMALLSIYSMVYPSTKMRQSIFHYEKSFYARYSRTQMGDASLHGQSNYFLPVVCPPAGRTSATISNSTTMLLFFLDSGGGMISERITQGQVEWISAVASRFPASISLVFMHIPTLDYGQIMRQPSEKRLHRCWGDQHTEQTSYTIPPRAFMQSLYSAGVRGVFVGHDHNNSWCCAPKHESKKIHQQMPALCYGRHTGYGGYDGGWERGGRVIEVNFSTLNGFSIATWIRMESGLKSELGVLFENDYGYG